MSWFKKEKSGTGTMEFSYVIFNKETGDVRSKRYEVPTYTNVVIFKNNFIENIMPKGYELIGSPFHRFNDEIQDMEEFKSCGKFEIYELI